MPKVVKKHIKQAILFYVDPDTGIDRRIIFGEAEETLPFFINNAVITLERLGAITNKVDLKKVKKPKDLLNLIRKTRRPWEKKNFEDTANDMEMSLTYEVKKIK